MAAMLFCNVGWMSRYEGLVGKPDKIVGGGKFVRDNETGLEVCNFLPCRDGYVYGHVETIKGKKDRRIRIEALGGTGDLVQGVDVIWTATDPDERGRKVVGWYRNATVFRERQEFSTSPSRQHARDDISSYRIRALAKDARRLELEDRTLSMGRGPGWMGHTPWWRPTQESSAEVRKFVKRTSRLLDGLPSVNAKPLKIKPGRNSSSAAKDAYWRYVQAYETRVLPRHSDLQECFERFLLTVSATELQPNIASVDLRYHDAYKGAVLAEIKPCERANARYAIRTAIGQLLDYQQHEKMETSCLIVLEVKPKDDDRLLATSNGFGVAYPLKRRFDILWPTSLTQPDA